MYYPSYEDYMRDVFYFNGLTNQNSMYPMMNGNQNLENMYPSIYRIVNPVVQKVVNGNNYQFVNEDTVNNIVDVVMGITAGDVNSISGNNSEIKKSCNGNNCQNGNSNSNQNLNNTVMQENTLLRDLIKILTIKELISRNNVRRFPYTYGAMPFYMNNQMMPYMVN
jgi:hypothetical protein